MPANSTNKNTIYEINNEVFSGIDYKLTENQENLYLQDWFPKQIFIKQHYNDCAIAASINVMKLMGMDTKDIFNKLSSM